MRHVAIFLFLTATLLGVSAASADHGNAYTSVFWAAWASFFAFIAGAALTGNSYEKITGGKSR